MDKKNFKLLLIAGHGNGDSGAVGNGYKEADLTRELVTLIKSAADTAGISCTVADTSRNYFSYLRDGGTYDFTPYTYVGEIHFNASTTADTTGDGRITGSMFYISQSETGHSVEDAILQQMYAIGGSQAWDGVVIAQRQFTGGLLVQERVRAQGVSHGLFETCFLSDWDDMDWYQKNKEKIAQAYIKGLMIGFGLSGENTSAESTSSGNLTYVGTGIGTAVSLDVIHIRSGAGTEHPSYGTIGKGTAVEVLGLLSNGWFQIVWPGAGSGYAYTSYQNGRYYAYTANRRTYVVKAGDTLSEIARRLLGKESRYPEIMQLNQLPSTTINVGQVLFMPEK